jgi:hypothetical protein
MMAIGTYIDRHNEILKPFIWTSHHRHTGKVKRVRRSLNIRRSV